MNRSTVYRQRHPSHRTVSDREIISRIRAVQEKKKYTYGIDRMTAELRSGGIVINHKRVARLMRENGLNAVIRKKRNYFCGVAPSEHGQLPGNLLNREFNAEKPGDKFASDVTYIPLKDGGWCYASLVKDLATSEIIACATSRFQNLALGQETLDQLDGKGVQGGMFHTDQGFLYTHPIFRERLESMGLVQSLSRKGNCLDNAVIESFNGTMKCEWFYPRFGKGRWNLTFEQAAKMVKEYVRYYNEERIQKKLGYLTPVQYREKIALLLE